MARVTPGQRRLPIRLTTVERPDSIAHPDLPPLPTCPIPLRIPCQHCSHPEGRVTRTGGQAVVSCARCHRYAYCAPRREQITWWGLVR